MNKITSPIHTRLSTAIENKENFTIHIQGMPSTHIDWISSNVEIQQYSTGDVIKLEFKVSKEGEAVGNKAEYMVINAFFGIEKINGIVFSKSAI